jgi:hypothetical protein
VSPSYRRESFNKQSPYSLSLSNSSKEWLSIFFTFLDSTGYDTTIDKVLHLCKWVQATRRHTEHSVRTFNSLQLDEAWVKQNLLRLPFLTLAICFLQGHYWDTSITTVASRALFLVNWVDTMVLDIGWYGQFLSLAYHM